jgi:hypothetical protein
MSIIIHVSVGAEKRTEFFSENRIKIGVDETCDLQIHSAQTDVEGTWLEFELAENNYQVTKIKPSLSFLINRIPLNLHDKINDGDSISIQGTSISFSFFSLESNKSALITTKREPHTVQFIEHAALEAGASAKRDDAKVFLREFFLELYREISLITKLIVATLLIGLISGIFYTGFSIYRELQKNREEAQQQNLIIQKLEDKLTENNDQLSKLDKTNQDIIKTVSLAPSLRVDYGNGTCLIFGTYDLVDRKNGKTLRYPDPQAYLPDPYEPPMEEGFPPPNQQSVGLTTEGNGTAVEYDFIGTGFHVGNGYIVSNRHVVQPWDEDDQVKQMMKESSGRARVKRLVVFFPNFPQPFPLKVQQVSNSQDLSVSMIDPNSVSPDISVLPLDANDASVAVGKTVVTMGYPNGPDRLLAMVDDTEAKSINAKFGNSRQNLINYLAQTSKIQPLTTQGAITDLDSKRIVHDAKTGEGGSGAPLFGQSGKVIGVNFGVFTESTAANMAIPIRYAIDLLHRAGWKTAEELEAEKVQQAQLANANSNANTANTNVSVAEKK